MARCWGRACNTAGGIIYRDWRAASFGGRGPGPSAQPQRSVHGAKKRRDRRPAVSPWVDPAPTSEQDLRDFATKPYGQSAADKRLKQPATATPTHTRRNGRGEFGTTSSSQRHSTNTKGTRPPRRSGGTRWAGAGSGGLHTTTAPSTDPRARAPPTGSSVT